MPMDELIIGEKKYISAKRAAKETGYARDYVGQLCREGRVPARLVGRSWYVLESAIQDHKSKEHDDIVHEDIEHSQQESEEKTPMIRTWESPRYEAEESALPTEEEQAPAEVSEPNAQDLHQAWKAWFDRFKSTDAEGGASAPAEEAPEAIPSNEEPETSIPLHVVTRHYPPRELLPEREQGRENALPAPDEYAAVGDTKAKTLGSGLRAIIRVGGVIIALALIVMTIIGSGVLDDLLVSSGRAGSITGISVYKN